MCTWLWFVQSIPSVIECVIQSFNWHTMIQSGMFRVDLVGEVLHWDVLPFAAVFWPHACHRLASTHLQWPAVSSAPPQPGLPPSWSVPPPPCCSLPLWTRNKQSWYQNSKASFSLHQPGINTLDVNSIIFSTLTRNKHSQHQNKTQYHSLYTVARSILFSMLLLPHVFNTSIFANVFTPC